MKPFAALSESSQRRRIRQEADSFAADFGLMPSEIRLVYFGFNATYSVRPPSGDRYAMRVNLNSIHSRPEVIAEVALVQHFKQGGIRVATPRATRRGDYVVTRKVERIDAPVHAVCYSWIEGQGIHDRAEVHDSRALAQLTRNLHRASTEFILPDGAEIRTVADPLDGFQYRFDAVPHADHAVVREVMARGQAVIDRLHAQQAPIPIHHDLHFSNVRRTRAGMAVFDFDDCRLGHPAQDVGVTMFYLRGVDLDPALETAYRAEFGPWPGDLTEPELETLMACRQVLLANDLIAAITAELRDEVDEYTHKTNARLRHFLKTGRFEPRLVASQ